MILHFQMRLQVRRGRKTVTFQGHIPQINTTVFFAVNGGTMNLIRHCCNYLKSFTFLYSLQHRSQAQSCDQMAKLFVQYLAIYNDNNLLNGIKYFAIVDSKCYQIVNKVSKMTKTVNNILPNWQNFAESVHTVHSKKDFAALVPRAFSNCRGPPCPVN